MKRDPHPFARMKWRGSESVGRFDWSGREEVRIDED
jgi:hypothetical protein